MAANSVRRIFRAAVQPVRGQRNKLPAVWTSFCDWHEDARKNFNLSRQLDAMGKDPALPIDSTHSRAKREIIPLADMLGLPPVDSTHHIEPSPESESTQRPNARQKNHAVPTETGKTAF